MKRLYALFVLCLAFVSIAMPAYADGGTWTGKGIKSVDAAATSVTAGKYYLMRQAHYGWWVTESNNALTGTSVSTDDLTSTSLTSAFSGTSYRSSVVYVGGESGAYTFQFKSGGYMGVLNQSASVSTGSTAETFTISAIDGLEGYFTVYGSTDVTYWSWGSDSRQSTAGWYSGPQYLDGNSSGPVGWHTVATSTSDNGCYQFFEVTLEDVDVVTVTYTIQDASGNTITTVEVEDVEKGASFPELTTSDLYTITGYPETTVSSDNCTATLTLTYTDNFPFTISSSTNDATWYGIVTRGDTKYLATNDDDSYIDLSTTWKAAAGSFDAYANVQNNRLWCVTGNPFDGFELYNKYAGKYISMSSTTDGTQATMVSESSDNTKFDLVYSSSNCYFKIHNSANAYLSDTYNWNPNNLRMWNSLENIGDAGSIMKFVAADDLEDLTAANIPTVSGSERVSSFNFWKDGISSMTETGEELYNAIGSVALETGKYYQILGAKRLVDYTMYADVCKSSTDESGYSGRELKLANNADVMSTLFTFELSDGLYYIKHANSGLYIGQPSDGNQVYLPVSKDNATTYEVEATSMPYYWQLNPTVTSGERLNINTWNSANNVVGYWLDGNDGSAWSIVAVDTIPVTITSAQYATLCLPFPVKLPDGVTAYTGGELTDYNGTTGTLPLTEIGTSIPSNTPVILYADVTEDTSYGLTILTEEPTLEDNDNALSGTTIADSTMTANTYYGLANKSAGVGFYLSSITSIPANKAYLKPTTDNSENAAAYIFSIGETTGITNAPVSNEASETKYYDLNGRRIFYPAHGIFVTDKGQKVLIK